MLDSLPHLRPSAFPPLERARPRILQVNLGRLCNQQCLHCHVAAGPNRREVMDAPTVDLVMATLERLPFEVLDLTGGAPELNPGFRRLVRHARGLGLRVIDRCNLSVLGEPGQDDLADFLAAECVEVVASLPCYLAENVDAQRGTGVFAASLAGLQRLNRLGYGEPGSARTLDLVYNPQGPSLPPRWRARLLSLRIRTTDRLYPATDNCRYTKGAGNAAVARQVGHIGAGSHTLRRPSSAQEAGVDGGTPKRAA